MDSQLLQSLSSPRMEPASIPEVDDLASDAELLAIFVATKNREAAERLIRRHSHLVAGLVRRMLQSSSDAEDAYQVTFLVLLKSASKIRKQGSLASWLYGVAYRTARRIRRQAKTRRMVAIDSSLDVASELHVDPLEKIATEIQLELLDRELQSLRPMLRDVLIEHHILGMSVPQIADRFELSNSAVEGRLRRGRAVLRQKLARRGISFSVAVAVAAAYEARGIAADYSDVWQQTLLHSQLFSQTVSTGYSPVDGPLTSLIRGEPTMSSVFATSKWISIAAASATIVGGFCAFQFISPKSGGHGPSSNPFVLVASATEEVTLSNPVYIAQDNAIAPSAGGGSLDASGVGGDYGGVLGSSEEYPGGATFNEPQGSRNQGSRIVPFKAPSGPLPNWMTSGGTIGEEEDKAREILRNDLRKLVKPDFTNVPLKLVIEAFSSETNVPFIVDHRAISDMGTVTLEDPITLTMMREMSLQRALKTILDPLDLTYVVEPDFIKITTKDHGSSRILRTYDLAYLLPSNEKSQEVVRLIQTVVPGTWDSSEESLTVLGSMLVASCPEEAHLQIESVLYSLSKMEKENITAPSNPDNSTRSGSGEGNGVGGLSGGTSNGAPAGSGPGIGGGMF